MSAPEQLVEARRWLRYATEDCRAAELLRLNGESVPRQACYLAQQAAEKAIKAALVRYGIDFPKTHNLNQLRNLLPPDNRVVREFPDLAELSSWVAEARYPGDWPEPTAQDAQHAVMQAQAVLAGIRADLASDGIHEPGMTPPGEP